MLENFTADFFAGNRAKLRQLFPDTAPVVVTANGLLQKDRDEPYGFRQDASFWYLTGIDDPEVILVMDKAKEYLIVPARSSYQKVFYGDMDKQKLASRSGISVIVDEKDGWKLLGGRLKQARQVATLAVLPNYITELGLYTNPTRATLLKKIQNHHKAIKILDISPHLASLRAVKQPAEIKAIQTAIDITVDSLKEALKPAKVKKYTYEYEVEAEITKGFRCRGAAGHGFEPIIAGGPRACILHDGLNNSRLSAGEPLLVDVGASIGHYSADITRTVLAKTATSRQMAIYQAVAELQDYAMSLLKPGVTISENEAKIEKVAGKKLRELGLITTINRRTIRQFYLHSTSHFLGINVHDVGNYNQPLVPGNVLTVEPGIYVKGEGIGVRIEDDILITNKGTQVLTAKLPRNLG